MKGRKRVHPGYHAARGWFYSKVQKVIRKWDDVFEREVILQTFQEIRWVMENAHGTLAVTIHNYQHRQFVCELMTALDSLHDPKNIYGWILRLWPKMEYKNGNCSLLSYVRIKEIIDISKPESMPKFTVGALRMKAKKMRLLVSQEEKELDEMSAHTKLTEIQIKELREHMVVRKKSKGF